ncbi:MAG: hypothetical protein AVDCRST_MAG44-115, partial [uncultured Sphingomonas sp.]
EQVLEPGPSCGGTATVANPARARAPADHRPAALPPKRAAQRGDRRRAHRGGVRRGGGRHRRDRRQPERSSSADRRGVRLLPDQRRQLRARWPNLPARRASDRHCRHRRAQHPSLPLQPGGAPRYFGRGAAARDAQPRARDCCGGWPRRGQWTRCRRDDDRSRRRPRRDRTPARLVRGPPGRI